MTSGDARIELEDEIGPNKGLFKNAAKTFIPFIVLFLSKVMANYILK